MQSESEEELRGDVYATASIGDLLVIARYDMDSRGATPAEFIKRYRAFFKLGPDRVTRFAEPSGSGCRLFMSNAEGSDQLLLTAIFVPRGVSRTDAQRELAEMLGVNVAGFGSLKLP